MATAPTQAIKEQIAPFLMAAGVQPSLTDAMWQALDQAGFTVITKAAGTAVVALEPTPSTRAPIDGVRGATIVGAKLGERGWLVCVEQANDAGDLARSAWEFVEGPGRLFTRAKTSGMWTVGTSAVGGTDKIT